MTVTPLVAAVSTGTVDARPWALQLGYFSNLQNAQRLKDKLIEAGFEAEMVATGGPGKQAYRIIGGRADNPKELDALRDRIQDVTGDRGYVMNNPGVSQAAQLAERPVSEDPVSEPIVEKVAEPPQTSTVLAQAAEEKPLPAERVGGGDAPFSERIIEKVAEPPQGRTLVQAAEEEPLPAGRAGNTDASYVEPVDERPWMLQLGYFSNLQNALNLKDQLTKAGFEAETVAAGGSGKQGYRVIAGWADDPETFDALRNRIEDATGDRGYVMKNPYFGKAALTPEEVVEDVSDLTRRRTLLAQAANIQPAGGESVGSKADRGYDGGMFRTPQDEIDSMPGFTAGGINIIPTLGLSLGYDDNITRANIDQQTSFFYMISPAISAELPTDHSVFALTAGIDVVRYTDSKIDDRDPWYVRGDWAWDASPRQDFNLFADYTSGVDQRGTGRTQGDISLLPVKPDKWKRWNYGGMWRYGAAGARGKLDLRAGASNLDYTNNRERTYLLDRDWHFYGGSFYWRVAPKTSLVADLLYTDINYVAPEVENDSTETSWMLGVSWDASARTSGTLRYGDQKKNFDDPEARDYNGPTWMASVTWRPRTYSAFTLTTTRNTQEPDGNAQYVVRQDIALAWVHDWATRFGTAVDIGYGQDDYRPDVRTDDIWYYGISAHYMFNPHFRFGASWQGYDQNSDIEEYSYRRNIYMLTLEASF